MSENNDTTFKNKVMGKREINLPKLVKEITILKFVFKRNYLAAWWFQA